MSLLAHDNCLNGRGPRVKQSRDMTKKGGQVLVPHRPIISTETSFVKPAAQFAFQLAVVAQQQRDAIRDARSLDPCGRFAMLLARNRRRCHSTAVIPSCMDGESAPARANLQQVVASAGRGVFGRVDPSSPAMPHTTKRKLFA